MIHVITGKPGEGKSWFASSLIPKFLNEGKDIGCNFNIADIPEIEGYRDQIKKVTSFEEIMAFKNGVLFLDEAQVWFSNRTWDAVPLDLQNKWQQHRKDRIDIFLCAQDISRIELTIRQLVGRYFSVRKMWNRIFVIREYEPSINQETQQIEEKESKRFWLQFARVKLDDPWIRLGFWEVLKLGWLYPHRIYETHSTVERAKDEKIDRSKSVSEMKNKGRPVRRK